MENFSDDYMSCSSERRELVITEKTRTCEIFSILWKQWVDTRAFTLSEETDQLVQVPLHRPGFPESKDDCDVMLNAYRRNGIESREELLELMWMRNVKTGCEHDCHRFLSSLEVNEEFESSLTFEARSVLEECRQKLKKIAWKRIG
ncbi:hypothetical protein HYZ99_01725 [Candidatus Peregrinibacteria bacterium]|nr:hypothetical protein [Candidatus Peregrinibacteria bacterium]